MFHFAKVSMIALLAVPSLPAAAAQQATEAPAAEAAPKEKLICKTQFESGSRTKKTRSCRTAAEWAELRSQTRQQIEKMQVTGAKY